jgi:GT2 family glycosyltransferase
MGWNGYAIKNKFPHRLSLMPRKREQYPKISIIIPTKNHTALLKQCVDSILLRTTYPNYELIIIDTGSDEDTAIDLINEYGKKNEIKVLHFKESFNFSKVNNFGANNADGAYCVFMNNDTEVITREWLENLLFYADSPGVGAVGPLLLFPNGTVQHAGVVLGFRGTTDHVMRNYPADVDGYFGSLSCAREVSAVTAACVMIKKEIFTEVNGFEENYNALYQDIDLCLKIRKKGYTIIYTPVVKLYHMESVTRGENYDFMDRMLLKDRWKKTLINDPYYNPNFTLNAYGKRHTGYEPKYRKNK